MGVKIAIRDDDVSFFTEKEDLIDIYKDIKGFPISFGVVPFIKDAKGGCKESRNNIVEKDIKDNKELVRYLKELYKLSKCEIVLHGFTHEYKKKIINIFQKCYGKKKMFWKKK